MHTVLTQHETYLRDVSGSPLRDGMCSSTPTVRRLRPAQVRHASRPRLGPLGRLVQRDQVPVTATDERQGHEWPAGPAHREGRMTWHTATVATDRMTALLTTIRSTGGTVTHCRPQADGVRLYLDIMTPSGHRRIAGTAMTQLALIYTQPRRC